MGLFNWLLIGALAFAVYRLHTPTPTLDLSARKTHIPMWELSHAAFRDDLKFISGRVQELSFHGKEKAGGCC
jgi:hypothetical protein